MNRRPTLLILSATTLALSIAWIALDAPDAPRVPEVTKTTTAPVPAGAPTTAMAATDAGREELDPRAPRAEVAGLLSAPAGSAFEFSLDNRGTSEIVDSDGRVLQTMEVRLQGELAIEILDRRGDEFVMRAALARAEVAQTVGGVEQSAETNGALAATLQRNVWLRAHADGSLLGLRFDAAATPEERNRVRALWSTLLVVAPLPLRPSWDAEQSDALGRVVASYVLASAEGEAAVIERVARRCLADAGEGGTMPSLEGRARYEFDADAGWWRRVELDESALIEIREAGWTVLNRQALTCELRAQRRGTALGCDWESEWSPADGAADRLLSAQNAREREMRERLGARSFDELVGDLAALMEAGDLADPRLVAARDELAWFLRLHPEAVEELARLALAQPRPSELAAALIDALGRAGNAEAQALLAEWIAGDDAEFARHGVVALIGLREPGPEVLAAAARWLGDDSQPELQTTALLALGAVSHAAGSHSGGQAAFDHVMAWKQHAIETDRLPEWIEALGNSGSPQVVDAVRAYLDHEDASIRASAVHALRLVFVPAVSELAGERGRADLAAGVRERAAEVLGARADAQARAAIAWMLENDAEAAVRQVLIQYLGAHLTQNPADVQARMLLADAAATDPDGSLREFAQQQLGGA